MKKSYFVSVEKKTFNPKIHYDVFFSRLQQFQETFVFPIEDDKKKNITPLTIYDTVSSLAKQVNTLFEPDRRFRVTLQWYDDESAEILVYDTVNRVVPKIFNFLTNKPIFVVSCRSCKNYISFEEDIVSYLL